MSVNVLNKFGQWVQVIPQPYYVLDMKFFGVRCGSCRRHFWRDGLYRGHYALEHILGLD